MSVPSFIFGAGTGLTYEQLQKRRQILDAMQARGVGQVASNTGEGLAQIGQAISQRFQGAALDRQEAEMQKEQAGLDATLGSAQAGMLAPMAGAGFAGATGPIADASTPAVAPFASDDIKGGIVATAQALGIDPIDLGTAISYETGGTFDPTKAGPTTQWGQHKGLIQFGEPQAKQYGVDWSNPIGSQLGPDGAVAKYLRDTGVKPGMGMLDIYSAINAGGVGRYNRSDANNGGAPGTVADKVNNQMAGHRAKAMALLGGSPSGGAAAAIQRIAPTQVASTDPSFMPETNVVPGAISAPLGTLSPEDQQRYMERIRGPQPQSRPEPYSGPGAQTDAPMLVYDDKGARMENSAAVGAAPAPDKMAALVAAVQGMPQATAQASPIAAMAPPQAVTPNPVPPQSQMAGLDPRTSPEAAALMSSGQFDGVSYSGGQGAQQAGQALPPPSIPAAPSGAVGQVAGAVQQAAQARGVDPRVLIGIANNPRATDGQRRVAQALLSQQMEQQQLLQKQAYDQRKTAEERAYEASVRKEGYGREDARFGVTDARDAARLDMEKQRFARESGKPIEVGGVLLDPATMKPVYTAPEKPTADIQEFEFARRNGYKGDFVQFQLDQKKAGAASTTINNGGDSGEFYKAGDRKRGEAFATAADAGAAAQRSMIQIGELEKRLGAVGTGGMASVKQMAANLGIPVEGADDIQAATAIINQLVPGQRPPGSGTMSDADVELFKQSLPRIINSEGGNAKILATMRGIAQYDAQRGAIANQVLNREITPAEGQTQMNAIPNPLAGMAEQTGALLPDGVTEDDIAHTMQIHGLTREQVLEKLR